MLRLIKNALNPYKRYSLLIALNFYVMRPKTNKANFDWKVTKREFDEDKYKNPLEDLKKRYNNS